MTTNTICSNFQPNATNWQSTGYNQPTVSSNVCGCRQDITYVIQPHVGYQQQAPLQCTPNSTEYGCPGQSYITADGTRIEAGDCIRFDILSDGIRIHNDGVCTATVCSVPGSGVIVTQTGTDPHNPKYTISVNTAEIIDIANVVTQISIDGVLYEPASGLITLSSAVFSQGIKQITSPNNTIYVNSTLGVGVVGIDVRPPKVNGATVSPDSSGTPFNIVNGANTTVTVTGNEIKIDANVVGGVNSITCGSSTYTPDATGNITLPGCGGGSSSADDYTYHVWQLEVEPTDIGVTTINVVNSSLHTLVPTQSGVPSTIDTTQGLQVFLNGVLVSPAYYTYSGTSIQLNQVQVPLVAGDKLTFTTLKQS